MRVAGIGFRRAASTASLRDALERAIGDGLPVQAVATESGKARAPVFRELAAALAIPALGVSASDLAQIITPTQSQRLQNQFGTGSLAEAAALVAAGPNARLITVRVMSHDNMATAAIADNEGTDT
ncbi:cobalamin biosynthesis protein [Roseovarius sp. Pro17]|uniref:cobalamin biosynthesis protein n=1 Tax=Roseovarius sp. Pro17 TaxID=3108175 RepID=UPI002D774E2E|nr:cobalamin biosynthesis protein [Roseovarius sp. Pro17]